MEKSSALISEYTENLVSDVPKNKIFITKPYLPEKEKYIKYIEKIFDAHWVTNHGQLVRELEKKLKNYLGVKNLILVSNGTTALQIAYKALNIKGEAITTPFSFVSTTSSLVWQGITPIFADINSETLCIDPNQIEKKITEKSSAIVATHIFGNACDIDKITEIAKKHNLKVIFDAAHAFDVYYDGKSILNYGDVSILSFHATKLFHTIEGGAIITNDDKLAEKIRKLINFGIENEESIPALGINAKMNEMEAAMGLCILDDIEKIIYKRKLLYTNYKNKLKGFVKLQKQNPRASFNYGYFPVIFEDENQLKRVQKALNEKNIFPRRYFYPSLDSLSYIQPKQYCIVSRNIANRILCLPLHTYLTFKEQELIIQIIKENI